MSPLLSLLSKLPPKNTPIGGELDAIKLFIKPSPFTRQFVSDHDCDIEGKERDNADEGERFGDHFSERSVVVEVLLQEAFQLG